MSRVQECWIDELSAWLLRAGFERVDEELAGFGDFLIRFKNARCQVIVGCEKLQQYIMLAPRDGDPAVVPKVWQAYLDGTDADPEAVEPLESQLSFVYGRLDEVMSAVGRDSEISERLLEINWSLVKARLGLDPKMPRFGRKS